MFDNLRIHLSTEAHLSCFKCLHADDGILKLTQENFCVYEKQTYRGAISFNLWFVAIIGCFKLLLESILWIPMHITVDLNIDALESVQTLYNT